AAAYLAEAAKAAALQDHHDDIPEDMLSVSPGGMTPLLAGDDDSDDDEIEVITSTQIESSTRAALAAGRGDYSRENSDEEEDLLHRQDGGGFGYHRVRNGYSDDEKVEPVIVVAGVPIPVPPSRARD
ncbi:hypothetical protein BFJ63_vAg20048, partial [Fusarium oxysporum f. sp. narcissi]